MKWIIASDIHGCSSSVEKLINIYEKEGCERMLLLGDILYHGPRNALPGEYDTQKCAEMLNKYASKIYAVRGNCDADVDQMVLDFPITADYMILPVEGKLIFASHGHLYGQHSLPPAGSADILMCGHTHVPEVLPIANDMVYINPGSTSIPKGGSLRSFILLDGKHMEFRYLDSNKTYKTYDM